MSAAELLLIGGGTFIALLLIYVLTAPLRVPKKVDPPVKKSFLEEALEADQDPRASEPGYGWSDLQRDLYDGKVTFNEIWDKCGGRLPIKPVVQEGQKGQDGGSSSVGAAGVSGAAGIAGVSNHEGPPAEEPPQGLNLKKLIGACPSKWKEIEPELPIWVKCCECEKTREYGYPRVCGMCGGKGYLIGREN